MPTTAAAPAAAVSAPASTLTAASCGSCWAFGASGLTGLAPKIPALGQALNSVSFSVARMIDRFGNWISGLPGNPITDFISGGAWLLRRTLFSVGADVGRWGTAACVTTGDCSGQDLTGADFVGQDLSGVDFSEATLTTANMGFARLTVANLNKADLTGANMASADLAGAAGREANFTGTNLTGAAIINADLAAADLSNANLSAADLTGANIKFAVVNGVIWNDTTCPNGSKSSTGCGPISFSESNKPGLLASDWLKVNTETDDSKFGFSNGDEPILLTTNLTTTLGYAGSSKSNVVDTTPNEIASGVDKDDTVPVPDNTGDNWINYWSETDADGNLIKGFVPISTIDIAQAALLKKAVPLPAIVTITMALEGDMSLPGLVGELGTLFFQDKLDALGKELEATKIYLGTSVKEVTITAGGSGYTTAPTVSFTGGRPEDLVGIDAEGTAILTNGVVTSVTISEAGSAYLTAPTVTFTGGDGSGALGTVVLQDSRSTKDQLTSVLNDAKDRISKALAPKWYEYAGLVMKRIGDWALSIGDPDDPVGLGATILIPVTSDVVDLIKKEGGPAAFGLDSNYTTLLDGDPNKPGRQDFDIDAAVWRTNIQVRVGLLVPPETGNKPQKWTTNYAGSYLENDWANWTVDTQAWVRTSW